MPTIESGLSASGILKYAAVAAAVVGFALPILTGIAVVAIRRKLYGPPPVPGNEPMGEEKIQ